MWFTKAQEQWLEAHSSMGAEALLQFGRHAIADQKGCGHLVAQAAQAGPHQAQVLQRLRQVAVLRQLVCVQQLVGQQGQRQLCGLRHTCVAPKALAQYLHQQARVQPTTCIQDLCMTQPVGPKIQGTRK